MRSLSVPDGNVDEDEQAYRERFIAAVERGLAESEAGLLIDDAELGPDLNAALDRLFGPLSERVKRRRG